MEEIPRRRYHDEGLRTKTSKEQFHTEKVCARFLPATIEVQNTSHGFVLERQVHIKFLMNRIRNLSSSYCTLDASRPWLIYWMIQSLRVLDFELPEDISADVVRFLKQCQHPDGGFGGGPGQMAHLATTYGAINAVISVGGTEAFNVVDRQGMLNFLKRMKNLDGSFNLHENGETDVRGCYSAVAVASSLNIADSSLFDNTVEYIIRCQTYEGGFGGVPGAEAHGGYSFCAAAALALLNKLHMCDLNALLHWASQCQMAFEGGFSGRTNKLVDGCYSFWVGSVFLIIRNYLRSEGHSLPQSGLLFNEEALAEYVLGCCQFDQGGLIDKPGKPPDMYHTCYTLCGLCMTSSWQDQEEEEGVPSLNPYLGICTQQAFEALEFFGNLQRIDCPTTV